MIARSTNFTSMVSVANIKRVVSVFILRPKDDERNGVDVAVFRRCETMPTFANHWAGICGSIEDTDGSPLEAALRELQEETNICDVMRDSDETWQLKSQIKSGLHLDVSKNTNDAFGGRIIRVYPFSLMLPAKVASNKQHTMWANIEMRGTEHDMMKFISTQEFFDLTPCVPGLQAAFHLATTGSFLKVPDDVKMWATDRVNGAAYLARKAVVIAAAHIDKGTTISQLKVTQSIATLRPTMVPIVNAMNEFDIRLSDTSQTEAASAIECDILQSLDLELERCVSLAVKNILMDYDTWKSTPSGEAFVIGTFSRSSTLKSILKRVLEYRKNGGIRVICSQSTPGNEGELMAKDIPNATWLSDTDFQRCVSEGKVNLVIVGADCILSNEMGIVNKVGTHDLAKTCELSATPMKCFADRWKLWDDIYPPPLETIFEVIPRGLLDDVVVPSSPE